MSRSTIRLNTSVLPKDIMELKDDHFFTFVQEFSGQKLASLLEFQEINSAQCLLGCDDLLEVLFLDSNDLLDLKKKFCVKLNDGSFTVLPGIKSKMSILKQLLLKKREEEAKISRKHFSTMLVQTAKSSSTDLSKNNSAVSTLPNVNDSCEPSISPSATAQSTNESKQRIIHLVNEWCAKVIEDEHQSDFHLEEGVDYEVLITFSPDKAFIECKCGSRSTLGQKNENYIVS